MAKNKVKIQIIKAKDRALCITLGTLLIVVGKAIQRMSNFTKVMEYLESPAVEKMFQPVEKKTEELETLKEELDG